MDVGMNLPVMVPGLDRATIEAWCRKIDEGPFSSVAVGERINFPNPELTVTIAAAAAFTRRVRVVYNVLVLPLHDEVMAAKQIATLDVLSEGRVSVAVGVGGREEDYLAVGATWDKKRLTRLEQKVARMRRIWSGEKAYEGALRPVEPFPVQKGGPEMLAGALFHPSIVRAAKWADGISGFSFSFSHAEVSSAFEAARSAWKEAGRERPPRLVTGFWFSLDPDGEAVMDDYLRRYLNFLGGAVDFVVPTVKTTSAQALKDALARARDLGADEVLLAPASKDPAILDRVADLIG